MYVNAVYHTSTITDVSLHVALFVYLSSNRNASAQREQSLALVLSRLQLPPSTPYHLGNCSKLS